MFDLGYLRVEKDFPEQIPLLPYKNMRNKELSSKEKKEHNKNHSKKE